MLTWAITRAGFDVDAYLEKNPQVKTWIDGEKKPTVRQLEIFADKVYIPYGFLLMEKQLEEKCPIPFFRTKNKGNHFNLNVYEAVITMQNRQHWLSEYLSPTHQCHFLLFCVCSLNEFLFHRCCDL